MQNFSPWAQVLKFEDLKTRTAPGKQIQPLTTSQAPSNRQLRLHSSNRNQEYKCMEQKVCTLLCALGHGDVFNLIEARPPGVSATFFVLSTTALPKVLDGKLGLDLVSQEDIVSVVDDVETRRDWRLMRPMKSSDMEQSQRPGFIPRCSLTTTSMLCLMWSYP